VRKYRAADGGERAWFDPGEIDRIMEVELNKALLLPSAASPSVDVERFIERHLGARLDQHADLEPAVLGLTEFFDGDRPKISINKSLTGSALDDGETSAGMLGRWRATLAHEAAHVLLHQWLFQVAIGNHDLFAQRDQADRGGRQLCLKRNASFRAVADWREVQANEGMAALLMPRIFFLGIARAEIERNFPSGLIPDGQEWRIAGPLAALLSVSKQAVTIRLSSLKLVAPKGQEQLF
jgi:hypothetical protein